MGTLSNTWRHIRRTPYQAFAAISVMTLTFLVAGLFFLLSLGSTIVLHYFEQKPQIVVFFKDTKKENDIQLLESKLKAMDTIASVKYVTKHEALSLYKEQFKNDPLLLEMVSEEILPASIEVSAIKLDDLPKLARTLQNEPDISEIVFPEDVVKLITSWIKSIRTAGIIIVSFLGLVSLFTVITVVSMKIALKKEEIEILLLVGATPWYIRKPFVMEGIVYGVVGAVLGYGINVGLMIYLTPFLQTLLSGIPLFPIPYLFYALFGGGMFICGMVLGIIASWFALTRYLR